MLCLLLTTGSLYCLLDLLTFLFENDQKKAINSFMTEVVIILLCKWMDWFLYDNDLSHERVKEEIQNN